MDLDNVEILVNEINKFVDYNLIEDDMIENVNVEFEL